MGIPIQRQYAALLDVLSAKTHGATPRNFADEIHGELDVLQMFGDMEELWVPAGGPTALTVGAARTIVVPGDQHWLLHRAAAWVQIQANNTRRISLSLNLSQEPNTQYGTQIAEWTYNYGLASGPSGVLVPALNFRPSTPMLLRPRSTLWMMATEARNGSDASFNPSCLLTAAFVRLT